MVRLVNHELVGEELAAARCGLPTLDAQAGLESNAVGDQVCRDAPARQNVVLHAAADAPVILLGLRSGLEQRRGVGGRAGVIVGALGDLGRDLVAQADADREPLELDARAAPLRSRVVLPIEARGQDAAYRQSEQGEHAVSAAYHSLLATPFRQIRIVRNIHFRSAKTGAWSDAVRPSSFLR